MLLGFGFKGFRAIVFKQMLSIAVSISIMTLLE